MSGKDRVSSGESFSFAQKTQSQKASSDEKMIFLNGKVEEEKKGHFHF
jgi:hypothetical protein